MAKLKFNPATPLYTSDAKAWGLDRFDDLYGSLSARSKPVVVFVHGRGKEPGKSLLGASFVKGLAVHKIERGYDVCVLMFNWDSAFPGLSLFDRARALGNTPAGAESLSRVLAALAAWQVRHPAAAKPALLVHSMGSVVIQHAVQKGLWPSAGPLFSSVLFSQPDCDDVGHAMWLDVLARKEQVYVTWSRDDKVLRRSTDDRPPGAAALGLGTDQPLSPHARYVDISRMGPVGAKDEDHEVFGKGAMNGQVHVCEFFTQVLLGRPVQLERGKNVAAVDRDVVYRLEDLNKPGAPCLKLPELPPSRFANLEE